MIYCWAYFRLLHKSQIERKYVLIEEMSMVCRILTQSDPKSQKISYQPTSKFENKYHDYATVCYLFSLCISEWYYICYIEKSDQRQSDIMKHVKKDRPSLFHYVMTKKDIFLLWTLKIKGQAWSNYFETVLPSSFSLQFRGFQIKRA